MGKNLKKAKYKRPAAYVALCQTQNGGVAWAKGHRVAQPLPDGSRHVLLAGISGIGSAARCALDGHLLTLPSAHTAGRRNSHVE